LSFKGINQLFESVHKIDAYELFNDTKATPPYSYYEEGDLPVKPSPSKPLFVNLK